MLLELCPGAGRLVRVIQLSLALPVLVMLLARPLVGALCLNQYSCNLSHSWISDQVPTSNSQDAHLVTAMHLGSERARFWSGFIQAACGELDVSRLSAQDIADINYWLILRGLHSRDQEQSLSLLYRALALEPGSSTVSYYIAEVYRVGGDDTAAVEWYRRALENVNFDPRFAQTKSTEVNVATPERSHTQLVRALMRLHRWSEAEDAAIAFVAQYPGSAEAYLQLGRLYLNLVWYKVEGRPAETLVKAERALQESGRLNPGDHRVHYYLGWVKETQGDLASAIEHYRQAVALSPNDATSLWQLGSRLMRIGKYEEALPYLERCVEHTPPDPEYAIRWVGLGDAYLALGNRRAAEQAYLTALSIQPDNEEARQQLWTLHKGKTPGDQTSGD